MFPIIEYKTCSKIIKINNDSVFNVYNVFEFFSILIEFTSFNSTFNQLQNLSGCSVGNGLFGILHLSF